MPLILQITNGAGQALGVAPVKTFDDSGGTIGRASGNDWVLPDPERHLSGRHAAVYRKEGVWYLADTSSNGVYVNDSTDAVGPDNPVQLASGDVLLLGDYQVEVHIEVTRVENVAAPPDPIAAIGAPEVVGTGAGAVAADRPPPSETLDPLELLAGTVVEPAAESVPGPAVPAPVASPMPAAPAHAAQLIPDDVDLLTPAGGPPPPPHAVGGALPGEDDPLLVGLGGSAAPARADPNPGFGAPAPGAHRDDLSPIQGGFAPPPASPEQIPEDWDILSGSAPPAPSPSTPGPVPNPVAPAAGSPGGVTTPSRQPPGFAPMSPIGAAQGAMPDSGGLDPDLVATELPPSSRRLPPEQSAARAPLSPQAADAGPGSLSGVAGAPPAASPAAGSANADVEMALRAFLEGAGLESDLAGKHADPEVMRLVGQIFRCVVEGMQETLRARAQFKSGFRMDVTMIRRRENNPLKFAAGGTEETMRNLLFQQGSSYQLPLEAFEEGFADLKEHQMAMVSGMKAALLSLLERFDPEGLTRSFEASGGSSSFLTNKKARYWDLYHQFHGEVIAEIEEDFQEALGKYFVTAYEEQVGRLAAARKKK